MKTKNPLLLIPAAVAAVHLLGGCAAHRAKPAYAHGECFIPEGQPRSVYSICEAQEAIGAGLDATLHPVHFDGEVLNTLGQEKLDLMVKDEHACCPLKVYLEVPQDAPNFAARRDAVAMYLKDKGLNDDQVKIQAGPNSEYSSPAAESLRELRFLQSGDSGGAAAPAAAAPAAAH